MPPLRVAQKNRERIRRRGLEVDTIEAQKWFSIAATLGDEDAEIARDQIASALSPAQIEEAQARADSWFAGLDAPDIRRP